MHTPLFLFLIKPCPKQCRGNPCQRLVQIIVLKLETTHKLRHVAQLVLVSTVRRSLQTVQPWECHVQAPGSKDVSMAEHDTQPPKRVNSHTWTWWSCHQQPAPQRQAQALLAPACNLRLAKPQGRAGDAINDANLESECRAAIREPSLRVVRLECSWGVAPVVVSTTAGSLT